jgi:anti-sigma B factor antagonist
MEVKVDRTDDGVAIVTVVGEVDMNTSVEVRNVLTPLFGENLRALVVDLSGVTYMDSSGVATLVEGLQWSHRSQVPFRLSGMTPAVKDVFEMARLDSLFDIYETREAALEGLA